MRVPRSWSQQSGGMPMNAQLCHVCLSWHNFMDGWVCGCFVNPGQHLVGSTWWEALGLRLHQYRLLTTIKPARGVPWCPNQSIKQRRQGESMQPSCCKRVLQHNQQVPLCAWVVCLCSSAVQPCRSVAPWCVAWCCSAAIKWRSRPMFLTLYVLWGAVNVIICIVWGC
jgi:hypothetical protein